MTAGKMNPFIRACAAILLLATLNSAHAQSVGPVGDLLLDAADANTAWRTSATNTLTVDSQIKVHGTASLKTVGNGGQRFFKAFSTPVDISRYRYLTFWYYIDRPDRVPTTGDTGQIELTSSSTFDSREWNWPVRSLHLQRGWNYVVLDLPGKDRDAAAPINAAAANFFRLYHGASGSITTRIDHILFTNREPQSFAFAEFLQQKRLAKSTTAVEQLDDVFAFTQRAAAGSAERAKFCRRLTMDLTHREVHSYSLASMGVTRVALDNELREKVFLKEFMCGQRTAARAELLSRLQQRASTEYAITLELVGLFDLTFEAAAETRKRVLDLDLQRILSACNGGDSGAVDAYIHDGTLPPRSRSFLGTNILVRDCLGDSAEIAGEIGFQAPPIRDRGATFRQCMAAFQQQGSECNNPYANADDDYKRKIDNIYKSDRQKADAAISQMQTYLSIANLSVELARTTFGTTSPNGNHPRFPELNQLHREFDQAHGSGQQAGILIGGISGPTPRGETPQQRETRFAQEAADKERLQAEQKKYQDKREEKRNQICAIDPRDQICSAQVASNNGGTPNAPAARCANMDLGDGLPGWFDRPAGASGLASQINEADRIDHCMCELFDRAYGASLPGDIVTLSGNCPTPEERLAQKCLENPYSFEPGDPVDPGSGNGRVRPECMFLMQPISMDRAALGARICEKVRPSCGLDAASMDPGDYSCGCESVNPNGTLTLPGCQTGIPNCPEGSTTSVDRFGRCGCQPLDSGANACMVGGKDFYLTRDRLADLVVREFPTSAAGATNLLVPKAGKVSIVTAGIQRSQLFNDRQLTVRAMLPVGGYTCAPGQNPAQCTGEVRAYCSRTSISANGTSVTRSNQLVDTVSLSSLPGSGALGTLTFNLDANERAACYGTDPATSRVHFEFFVDSVAGKPVALYDILGELGNIKPPCIQTPRPGNPTPGPRPFDRWPARWTLSDGTSIDAVFNGTGPLPEIEVPQFPGGGICVIDGIPMPCP